MFSVFAWIESSAFSVWLRESPSLWVFPFVLILHTVGMGFLVGTNVAIDLRVLGLSPRIPLSIMERFLVVMKLAFFINAVSGILLLIAYPTKALTNPLFYLKLTLIAFALLETRWILNQVIRVPDNESSSVSSKARLVAGTSLLVWAAAITAGRLLAYTYTYLMAGE